jgi:predicted house-cleaning NTP pyrophosphatase (Maf/HAM1 superfamily)
VVQPSQPTNHLQAATGGVLPQQQQRSLVEHINDSSSQVYGIPLYIMGTQTLAIIVPSNTYQVVSLKLMNTNYLYW